MDGVTSVKGWKILCFLRALFRVLEPCLQVLLRVCITSSVSAMPLTLLNAIYVKFALVTGSDPGLTRAAMQGFVWTGVSPNALTASGKSILYMIGMTQTKGCYIGQTGGGIPARWPRHARALASCGNRDDLIHLKWYKTLSGQFRSGQTPWVLPLCEVPSISGGAAVVARLQMERNAIRCLGRRAWNSVLRIHSSLDSQKHVGLFRWLTRNGPHAPERCYRVFGPISLNTTIPALAMACAAGSGGVVLVENTPAHAKHPGRRDPCMARQLRFEAELLRLGDATSGKCTAEAPVRLGAAPVVAWWSGAWICASKCAHFDIYRGAWDISEINVHAAQRSARDAGMKIAHRSTKSLSPADFFT